jgi:hypothetical protein
MNGQILGVSITTLIVITVTALVVRKYGDAIPLLNSITPRA